MNGMLDWTEFEHRFKGNCQIAFENLSYHIFCKENGIVEGLPAYYNQKHIETDPFTTISGLVIGFQAKYYESPSITSKQKKDLIKAIEDANVTYNLDILYFYLSRPFAQSSKKGKSKADFRLEIEEKAKALGIEIRWVVPKQLEIILNNPNYSDLFDYFFGDSSNDEIYKKKEAIQFLKERILQQKREHPSFRLLANDNKNSADELLFPEAIQLSERYMTYHDEHDKESEPIRLSEFIANSWKSSVNRHLQIQGVGGIGKTVTLLSIATEHGFLPHEVPAVYIPLYELNGYSEEKGIENYLENNFPDYYEFIKSLSTKPWKDGPNLILLLDGFNEITLRRRKNKVWCDVREWAGKSGVQIITTSRSYCGFAEYRFVPVTLQKLSEKQVIAYLQKYNNEHNNKMEIPEKGNRILSVLNIPLMLTLYLQIEGIKEKQGEFPYLEFRESNNSGNLIRNYVQKEILNYSEYIGGNNIGQFVYSITAVLPYVMYKMEREGKFSVTKEKLKALITESIQYYEGNSYCIPNQVRESQRGNSLDYTEIDEADIFSSIVEKSSLMVLSTGNDNVDVYRPMHQDFRDGLSALFLCNVGLGKHTKENYLPIEYQETQRETIMRFMSEMLTPEEAFILWERNRLYKPTNTVSTRLLLDVIGRKTGFDYADLNFSEMDLSNVLLSSFLDNHPGLPRKKGAFRKTKLSENTFIPIGHAEGVDCVNMNSYGDKIISGSFDRTLRIWDLDSGECKCILKGHSGSIRSISVSRNGKMISGSDDKTLRLWDTEDGKFIQEYKGHSGSIRSVFINSNGKWAISGSYDKTVRIWNLDNIQSSQIIGKHLYKVTSLAVYEPKSLVVSGDDGGCLSIIDIRSMSQTDPIRGENGRIIGVYFINNGESVISGTSARIINLWNIESGKLRLIKKIEHNIKEPFTFIKVCPDEKHILVGTYHWNIYLIEIETGHCIGMFERHTDRITEITVCEDGGRMISSSWDGTIRVWDMLKAECMYTLGRQKNCLTSVSMSSDGEHIISGFRNGAISVWDVKNQVCKRYFREDNGSILSVSMDGNGKSAITGAWNGTVKYWDLENGKSTILDNTLANGIGVVHNSAGAVSISADGQYVLMGRRDQKLYLWEKVSNKTFDLLKNQMKKMISVSIDANGEKAVSVDWHGTLYIWNLKEHNLIKRIKNDEDRAKCVMIDYEGRYIVTGSYNRLISLFDTNIKEGNQLIGQIGKGKQYTGRVNSVAISANGQTIVSGSREKTMCVWDGNSRKRRYSPQKHKGRVISVAISMDGKSAVSGDTNDEIHIWKLGNRISRYTIRPFVDYDLIGVDLSEAEFETDELKELCRQNGAIVS